MSWAALFALAVSLAMDSFAASLGRGAATGRLPGNHVFAIAAMFGLCEATALAGGWVAGYAFSTLIISVDHWIAFGLLMVIGLRMIRQGFLSGGPGTPRVEFRFQAIATAVATSIDAAVVGISLAIINVDIVRAVLTIGAVTFLVTLTGASIGRKAAPTLGRWAEVLGGAAMVVIGTVILRHHLYA